MNFPHDGPTGLPLAFWLIFIVIALAASITVWAVTQLVKSRRKSELLKAADRASAQVARQDILQRRASRLS